jgi:hypothetical protein
MSHFYGTLKGNKGGTSRCGSKNSGMETYTASWAGAVRVMAYVHENGEDWVRVELTRWHGAGTSAILYEGPISGEPPTGNGRERYYAPHLKEEETHA